MQTTWLLPRPTRIITMCDVLRDWLHCNETFESSSETRKLHHGKNKKWFSYSKSVRDSKSTSAHVIITWSPVPASSTAQWQKFMIIWYLKWLAGDALSCGWEVSVVCLYNGWHYKFGLMWDRGSKLKLWKILNYSTKGETNRILTRQCSAYAG